jgi:hypothetical protein
MLRILLLLSLMAQISSMPKPEDSGLPYGWIEGVVVDPDGKPVEDARVYAASEYYPPMSRPWSVTTNAKGEFVLDQVIPGNNIVIHAYKEYSDHYKDAVFAFDLPPKLEMSEVEVKPGQTVTGIIVRLAQKAGKIHLNVRDADNRELISTIGYKFCREDYPTNFHYCLSGGGDSDYDQFMPIGVGISITVEAEDGRHERWEYRDPKTGSPYFRAKSAETETIDVYLHKDNSIRYPQPDLMALWTAQHRDLYDRLVQRSETDSAAAEIARWASYDPGTRDFFASKLPPLIVDQFPRKSDPRTGMLVWNPVWLNAVRLAGQLKVVAAIPGLKRGLSKPPTFGAYDDCHGAGTMTSNAKLCNDVVARALADIGDPSVPVVAHILSRGDFNAKRRAMWILLNIDSAAAKKVMVDDLPRERDPEMKLWIQETLNGDFQYNLK